MRTFLAGLLAVALACLAAPAGAAAAGDGGASAPGAARDGGGGYGIAPAPKASKRPAALKRRGRRFIPGLVLEAFRLERERLFAFGRPARVSFRLRGRGSARVRLTLTRAGGGEAVSRLDLGLRDSRAAHSVLLTGRESGLLAEGAYVVHIAGRPLRRGSKVSSTAQLQILHHRFPLDGAFSYGGAGSLFGAPRKGHSHQGHDLAAAAGTPVLAPRGGVVEAVQYQAAGAGHYVVVNGEDEQRHYVFMHLLAGSIPVREGQRVRTGQLIGEVGSSGTSTGPHLHFEIWAGGWFAGGGHPIDPLPALRRWDAWS